MGRISVELKLANDRDILRAEDGILRPEEIRQSTVGGVVDTGATRLVIPSTVAEQLGLPETGEVGVRYADGRTGTRKVVENIRVTLLGREFTFRAIVEPDRDTALIGAIVLEELDFVVDCVSQRLYPRDPNRIISEIE
jgi:predicted aspartyl protease